MARNKKEYKEGSCIIIPLRTGGYARCIVARIDGKGGIFGYFFGPKYHSYDDIEDFSNLRYQDAILAGRFGDNGLINGTWKIIDELKNWNSSEWPMPAFIRVDEIDNRAWLSYYNENDFSFIREEEVSPTIKDKYPYDRDMGYGAVEIRLTKMLNNENAQK